MKLSQFVAGCFGITGAALSVLAGLYANNALESILGKAALAALICYVVGFVVGAIAGFVAREQAERVAVKVSEADAAEAARRAEAAVAAEARNTVEPVAAETVGFGAGARAA